MTSRQPLETQHDIAPEDRLRADFYGFLGHLLAAPPDDVRLANTARLQGDDTEMGKAVDALARAARRATPKAVEAEFTALFIGLGRGELLPYASYYMTGFLNEKPLAQLRADMAMIGMSRASEVFEPEDNIASLCEVMAGMIDGRFSAPTPLDRQQEFFFRHLAPWAGHFFSDLEAASNAVFYAPVGRLGRCLIGIETQAFRMHQGKPDSGGQRAENDPET